MILDTLPHALAYRHLGPRFAAGLQWLAGFAPATPDGRVDLEGDDLFALVQSYDTAPAGEKKYESHRTYADIQCVISGTEVIHHAPTAGLTPVTAYDDQKDYLLYGDPSASTPLHLAPGTFAIFFPHDGHKPGCLDGGPCRVKKVVLKVRL